MPPQTQKVERPAQSNGQRTVAPNVSGTAVRKSTNVVPVQQNRQPSKAPSSSSAARKPTPTAQAGGQPAQTRPSAPPTRLDDPGFKQQEALAAKIVMQLKEEAKKYYERLGKKDPEVRYGGRFLHNREVCVAEVENVDRLWA